MIGNTVAKGQKKSNREAKKPKKTDAEKLKAKSGSLGIATSNTNDKGHPKKP